MEIYQEFIQKHQLKNTHLKFDEETATTTLSFDKIADKDLLNKAAYHFDMATNIDIHIKTIGERTELKLEF